MFGSVAAGSDTAVSDIDLLVVGSLSYAELMPTLTEAESSLQRKVNPKLYTASELQQKLQAGNAFVNRVLDQPKIFPSPCTAA